MDHDELGIQKNGDTQGETQANEAIKSDNIVHETADHDTTGSSGETFFRWQIDNEKDIQFVTKILHTHKNPLKVSMSFWLDMEYQHLEQLAQALPSSHIQKLRLLKETDDKLTDLSVVLQSLQHINSLQKLAISFEPKSNESEAVMRALGNPHLRNFFAVYNDDLWQSTTSILSKHIYLRKLQIHSIKNAYQNISQILSENKILETLVLMPDEDITADEMTYLISGLDKNTTLKSLKIVQGEDQEIPMLCNALAHNQIKISTFHFSVDDASESTMKALSRALRTNTCLKKLVLSGTIAKCKDFGEALKQNSTLEMLKIIAREPLAIEVLENICSALKSTSRLPKLALSGCDHFGPIVDMLLHNKTLKRLSLSSLKLNDEYLTHICEAIAKNNTLTSLNVGKYGIYGATGLKSIGDMLKTNNSLRKLTVKITRWDWGFVCEGLRTNTSVTDLCFQGDIVDFEGFYGTIAALLEHNYALTAIRTENDKNGREKKENQRKVEALLKRNRQLKSEAQFKVVVLSHNIARSREALAILPRELWVAILSLVIQPGMEPFDALVKKICHNLPQPFFACDH